MTLQHHDLECPNCGCVSPAIKAEIERLQKLAKEQGQEIAITREQDERLRAPFEAADEKDWTRLDQMLGFSAHGKFWRERFKELRTALEQSTSDRK